MKPEEKKLLEETVQKMDNLEKKLNSFLDVYYRTNMIDKTLFTNKVVFNNNIEIGKNGTKIGTSTQDKIAFFNTTPVVQPATISDPSGGATQDAESRTAIATLIDRLQELGLIA